MGKASRELKKAVQDCYETDEIVYNDSSDKETEELLEKEICENYDRETAVIIRTQLIEYAQNGAYPLCEFLDIENTANFTKWLLLAN